MSPMSKLQQNTMAGCGIPAKKGKKLNKNIKNSSIRTIQNTAKTPSYIVSVTRFHYYNLDDL